MFASLCNLKRILHGGVLFSSGKTIFYERVVVHEMQCFDSFSEVLEGILDVNG